MNSLVADYGTSSGESDSDQSEDEQPPPEEDSKPDTTVKLPKPDFECSSSENSVFKNPFVEAENAKKAILEKHVKMVPTKDKVQMINGKKICWNYRKGRCRFGHNCTFAHDTDLHKIKEDDAETKQNQNNTSTEGTGAQAGAVQDKSSADKNENHSSKKKRPGLSNNIVPSKKVMKIYKQQRLKEPK